MKSPEMRFDFYFATPIITGLMPDAGGLNEQLRSLFLSMAEKGQHKNQQLFNTNIGDLYDSHFDLFKLSDKPVQDISNRMKQVLLDCIAKLGNYTPEQMKEMHLELDAWFHVSRKGSIKTLHNHPNASWSMVYYVDPGDEGPVEERSGFIQFYDPRGAASAYQDKGNMRWPRVCTFNGLTVQPKAGLFVVFPSYLYHEVLVYRGNKERIMIAVNAWVK